MVEHSSRPWCSNYVAIYNNFPVTSIPLSTFFNHFEHLSPFDVPESYQGRPQKLPWPPYRRKTPKHSTHWLEVYFFMWTGQTTNDFMPICPKPVHVYRDTICKIDASIQTWLSVYVAYFYSQTSVAIVLPLNTVVCYSTKGRAVHTKNNNSNNK